MIFSLIADATEEASAQNGLTTGAVVALIIFGVIMLAVAVFGIIVKARNASPYTKRDKKHVVEHAPTIIEEDNDFEHLSKEEKDVIRAFRKKSD